jgi:ComF family protein
MARAFFLKLKGTILDFLFPKTCFGCQREGTYLCSDCLATLDILNTLFCLCPKSRIIASPGKCPVCRSQSLSGLYFAVSYKNSLVKNLLHRFKYSPYVKELAKTLASLIIVHFKLIEKEKELQNSVLVPVPLEKTKLKARGFNQSEEMAKELVKEWKVPLINNCLEKIKTTENQMELSGKEREENLKGAFAVKSAEQIQGKKIFLIDDVYTTGATLEECAKILKQAGAKEVWAIAVARG